MKTQTLFFLLFSCFSLSAQQEFEKVDSIVKAFQQEYTDASDLARQLTRPIQTEREKARAIFAWVAFNIRYDYKKYKDPPPKSRVSGYSPEEIKKNMEKLREKEIRHTLVMKKGVCGDYSRLVQKMCEAAGLEAVFIGGTSRTMSGRGGNHAWNAVKYDGNWHLLDATWGAGFVDEEEDRFIHKYRPGFFGTPPSFFILNHLPDEDQWQLLDKALTKKEFNKQPAVNFSNPDYPIEAFTPENGIIVPAGDKAEIRLKLGNIPKVFVVAAGESREIPAAVKTGDDGWVTLTFSPGRASEISVYGGKSLQKMSTLVQFSVE